MAQTTSLPKEVRPLPLQSCAKQVSIDMDPMDPIAWNLDPSLPEDLGLLGNVVELEQDEIVQFVDPAEDPNPRKRSREEEEETEDPREENQEDTYQGSIPSSVSLQSDPQDIIPNSDLVSMTTDERPRVSRRRKKKPKGFPKRPLGAYGIYYRQERQRIVETMTESSLSEDDIQRQVGRLWRSLPEEETKKYEDIAEQDKARYQEEMAAHEEDAGDKKPLSKKNLREVEEERGYFAYDFPPPPPGVTVIPATGGGSDAGSVAAAAGMKEASPSSSPVPPPLPPRWGYGPPPVHPPAAYPSPVPSAGPQMVRSAPYPPRPEYYPAIPPSPGSWVTPPSPYRRPPRGYSPHFGRPARVAPVYIPPPPRQPLGYSIPPGMELALPGPSGGERKYRVSYRCYRMRAEDVQGFLDSMNPRAYHPPPPHPHHPHAYGHPAPRW